MGSASEMWISVNFVSTGDHANEGADMNILADRQAVATVKIKLPIDQDSAGDRKVFRPEESAPPDADGLCGYAATETPH